MPIFALSFDEVKVLVAQSCPTLCDRMDYSSPAPSVHGILQSRILEWVAVLFSRGSSRPRYKTEVSHIAGRFFTVRATREALKASENSHKQTRCKYPARDWAMYGCERWTIKKAEHGRTDAFELWCWRRLLRKEIKPVSPKANQSWIFIGRNDAEAEALILWPPDAKSWLIGKDPDVGKDWGQEEKGTIEQEMVGWH